MSESTGCPKETPFFIVGNPRSGTTLLTFILSSHPRIHIPGETGFLPRLTKYAHDPLSSKQVKEIINIIHQNRDWSGIIANVKSFYEGLPSKTLSCILDTLYRLKIEAFNAVRWGDKTPSYVRYIPQIDQIFPDAQFIHIIRDGRDSALSAQQKWGKQRWYMDSYYLLMNWQENVKVGRLAGKGLGSERYIEIKYESLVQNPKETVEQVCAFLNDSFHPDMLEHSKLAQKVITPAGHMEVLNPINTQSVERWRKEMMPFQKKLADELIGATLTELGYPTAEYGPLSPLERMKMLGFGARYKVVNSVRSILYEAGLLTLNRGKLQNR